MIDENKLEAGYEAVAEHMSFGIYRAAVKAYEAAKAEEQVVEYHQAFIDAAIHGQGFMKDGKHIPRSEVFKSSDNPNQPPESAAGSEWRESIEIQMVASKIPPDLVLKLSDGSVVEMQEAFGQTIPVGARIIGGALVGMSNKTEGGE